MTADTDPSARRRTIRFDNVFNFRDLGGHRTADGRTVRWGRLFRSEDLRKLQEDDIVRFAELGIRTVVDLRHRLEVERDGRIQCADITYLHVCVDQADSPRTDFTTPEDRTDYLVAQYLATSELGGRAIGTVLRTIADPETAPLVFHCLAGKDRTGLIAAFVLHLLGVGVDDIADDYALSEAAEEPNFSWHAARYEGFTDRRWERYTVTPREAMAGFFAALEKAHGSVDAYLASVGVGSAHVDALRSHLLTTDDAER